MKESRTFRLSEQTIHSIDELSSIYDVSATEVVEKAVQGLYVMICVASNVHNYSSFCKTILEKLLHIHVPQDAE